MGIFKTRGGQSISDIAIEVYGGIEGVFALLEDNAALNNSLDVVPSAGMDLSIRDTNPVSAEAAFISTEVNRNEYKLASAPQSQTVPSGYVAIGYVEPDYVM